MATETKTSADGGVEVQLYTVEVCGKPTFWHCWKCDGSWQIGKKDAIFWWECD